MPGCVLRISGNDFDPDAFLAENKTLQAYKIVHRGESMGQTPRLKDRRYDHSGFRCDVSDSANDDLETQIKDAIDFLKIHRAALERLSLDANVENRWLDFGCTLRMGENVIAQSDYFPPELLRLAGALNIGIELSLYPAAK